MKYFAIPIIKKSLGTKCTIKSKEKLWNRKNHIFVKKVEDHF